MPGPDSRRDLGAAGESAACAALERRGYRILARNARADRVELDVVAERAGVVVFVEVKTRRGALYGSAAEAIDARKRARIARGAAAWLRAAGRRPRRVPLRRDHLRGPARRRVPRLPLGGRVRRGRLTRAH
jgi:putative endonuclease